MDICKLCNVSREVSYPVFCVLIWMCMCWRGSRDDVTGLLCSRPPIIIQRTWAGLPTLFTLHSSHEGTRLKKIVDNFTLWWGRGPDLVTFHILKKNKLCSKCISSQILVWNFWCWFFFWWVPLHGPPNKKVLPLVKRERAHKM